MFKASALLYVPESAADNYPPGLQEYVNRCKLRAMSVLMPAMHKHMQGVVT